MEQKKELAKVMNPETVKLNKELLVKRSGRQIVLQWLKIPAFIVCMFSIAFVLEIFDGRVLDYSPREGRIEVRVISGTWQETSIVLLLTAFVVSFSYLVVTAGKRDGEGKICLCPWDKIPLEVFTVIIGGLGVVLLEAFRLLHYGETVDDMLASYLSVSLGMFLATSYCMSVVVRLKTKTFWRYTLLHYLIKPFRWLGGKMQSNIPLFVKALLLLTGISFLEWMVIASLVWDDDLLVCFFLFKLVEYPLFILVLYQLDQIKKGGMRVAAGDYGTPIDTRHMFWEFKRHAENINNVGNGISLAVEEKMKSERFRTELIANVSHDIKTPLTSVISYVDLIQKEEIENPAVKEYVEVLDRQSQRLKKLIEDLMEASKASSGSLPVHMELCDATVMLTQVIGEFKERTEANNLELIVTSPNPPVNIMADGRHLWRVLDNLMSNICKYAMPNTRVYIDLEQFHGMVIMTFRNISKARLNIDSEELMERFVRGDSSRNTEGSGLGLSIAQSLTGLMNGNIAVQIDGDLFKAIVSFQEVVKKKGNGNTGLKIE